VPDATYQALFPELSTHRIASLQFTRQGNDAREAAEIKDIAPKLAGNTSDPSAPSAPV
jgi:hypothetical protein